MKSPPLVTELVHFNFSTLPTGDSVPSHLHLWFQLDVILEGELYTTIEKRHRHRAQAGDAWLIPPLIYHSFQSSRRYRQASFKFYLSHPYWPVFNTGFQQFTVSPTLLPNLEETGVRQNQREPLATQHATAVLTQCLIESLTGKTVASVAPDHLDSFRHSLWPLLEKIVQQPQADWSVASMARHCHLSIDHFSRSFRNVLGTTPCRYLQEIRLRDASVELLATPPLSIKEIAARTRYASVHAFSKAFRKVFFISPAAYRDSMS